MTSLNELFDFVLQRLTSFGRMAEVSMVLTMLSGVCIRWRLILLQYRD